MGGGGGAVVGDIVVGCFVAILWGLKKGVAVVDFWM